MVGRRKKMLYFLFCNNLLRQDNVSNDQCLSHHKQGIGFRQDKKTDKKQTSNTFYGLQLTKYEQKQSAFAISTFNTSDIISPNMVQFNP